jgi:hypothetical protein
LRNTAIKFLDYYEAKRAEHRKKFPPKASDPAAEADFKQAQEKMRQSLSRKPKLF